MQWSTKVQVATGGVTVSVDVPELPPVAPQAPVVPPPSPFVWTRQRIAGVSVAGGAGLAGLAVGAVFGVKALSQNGDSKAQCQPQDPALCNPTGAALYKDAVTSAHVSTGSLVAGGAAVVAGLVVFLTASRPKAPADKARVEALPMVGAGTGGLAVRGVW